MNDTPQTHPATAHPRRHRRALVIAALIAATTFVIAAPIVAVRAALSEDTPAFKDPQAMIARLYDCAAHGAEHPIAECDETARTLATSLAREAADNAALDGHQARYLQALKEHHARSECASNPSDPQSLCRLDYIDLAVMADDALKVAHT